MTQRPIFVIGAPRSGTTLLRSLIDGHPRLCLPPWETGIFDRFSGIADGSFEEPAGEEANFCPFPRSHILDWIRQSTDALMQSFLTQTGKARWGEKTPSHVFHVNLIREIYPEAQFIHIIRNGNDVIKSLMNVHWGPRDIRWSVNRWIDSVKAGQIAKVQHGSDVVMEVRYEELTADTEHVASNICEFLREDYEPTMLDFHLNKKNPWNAQSQKVSKQPIYSNKYRNLNAIERIYLKHKAGSLLREIGY